MAWPWCFVDQGYPWEHDAVIGKFYWHIAQFRRVQLLDACMFCGWSVTNDRKQNRQMTFEAFKKNLESYLMSDILNARLTVSQQSSRHNNLVVWLAIFLVVIVVFSFT